MSLPAQELANLNRVVHAPPRLAILTVLLGCQRADFTFLLTATALTKGNLASNISVLEEAGLVESQRLVAGRRPRTDYWLSHKGREAIEAHWQQLDRLRVEARLVTTPG